VWGRPRQTPGDLAKVPALDKAQVSDKDTVQVQDKDKVFFNGKG
jgi:hypothetical protein